MRTTVTLDPDLAATLRRVARERRISFTAALNATLRRGLSAETEVTKPYTLPTRRLALRPGIDLDKALLLADRIEDAETIRKLELRK